MEYEFKMRFFIIILALASISAKTTNTSSNIVDPGFNPDGQTTDKIKETIDMPDNNTTIVFVLDGESNWDEIKTGIGKDFGNLENHNKYSYSLVQYNGTDAKPMIIRKSLTSFRTKLEALPTRIVEKVVCPNEGLKGIEEGLKESLPDSFMIVFTSGYPLQTDDKLLSRILSTVAEKRIRVFCIVNGICNDDLQKPYKDIAAVSNGFYFESQLNDIGQALNLLMNSPRVDLLQLIKTPKNLQVEDNEVLVDETMSEILISVYSSHNYKLRVFDPSGQEIKKFKSSYRLSEESSLLKMGTVQEPEIGKWKIRLEKAETYDLREYSLQVSAVSSMKINFGFDNDLNSSNTTFCQPIPDKVHKFFVNLDKSSLNASVSLAQIISQEGKEIKLLAVNRMPDTQNLFFSEFDFNKNDSLYHLQITGETNKNTPFQRITPIAFGSQSGNFINGSRNCNLPFIIPKIVTPPTQNPPNETSRPKPEINSTRIEEFNSSKTEKPPTQNETGISPLIIALCIIVLLIVVAVIIIGILTYMKPTETYKVQRAAIRKGSLTCVGENEEL